MKKVDSEQMIIDSIMKKSVEDVINSWKNKIDEQVKRFTSSAENLKEFETKFLKNCDLVTNLFEITNAVKEEAEVRKTKLEDISRDEDTLIDQLTIMDSELDRYISMVCQNNTQLADKYEDVSEIYKLTEDISSCMREVQDNLNEISERISMPVKALKTRESVELNEKTKNQNFDFTEVLNSYYQGLRSIQMMEQHLLMQIENIEEDMNEKIKLRSGFYNKFN